MTYIQGNYHFELRNLPYLSPWMHWTPCTPLNMKSLAMSSALRTNQQWSFTCRSEALNEAKWNLGKVKIKPMLPVLQDQGRGGRGPGRSAGVLPCVLLEFLLCLLACLLFPPSHTFGEVSIPHTGISCSVLCWQVPGGGLWLGCNGDLLTAEEIAALLCCYILYLYSTYPPIVLLA